MPYFIGEPVEGTTATVLASLGAGGLPVGSPGRSRVDLASLVWWFAGWWLGFAAIRGFAPDNRLFTLLARGCCCGSALSRFF